MSVPAPRRTAPRPPARRPEARRDARRIAVAVGVLCLVAAVAAAPPAPLEPTGCGDLVRGQLCLRGPVGADGTYTATYRRLGATASGADEILVRLGYQRKNTRITAFPGWFGTRRTQGGTVVLSGRVEMLADECIRGVMERGEAVYVTKWSCS
ncbi:hypothetical protein OHT20_24005 [Streptomyces caniferus]|uniref:Uncharacterized protein n=1 Tax=Streptomyces caniferus TaxID=285557 RepID=A0A640SLE2_9ACTN|nr:hypothetical protein [Streptomyces caniferus]GFE10295.1 hypothetical protein Scani_65630 [Streptomyces caniferus]